MPSFTMTFTDIINSLYILASAIEPIDKVHPALLKLKELFTVEKLKAYLEKEILKLIDERLDCYVKYWLSDLPFILDMIQTCKSEWVLKR